MLFQNQKSLEMCLSSLYSVLSKVLCLVNAPSASRPQIQMLRATKDPY